MLMEVAKFLDVFRDNYNFNKENYEITIDAVDYVNSDPSDDLFICFSPLKCRDPDIINSYRTLIYRYKNYTPREIALIALTYAWTERNFRPSHSYWGKAEVERITPLKTKEDDSI